MTDRTGPALLAVENRCVGYQKAQDALKLATAAEKRIVLWPLAINHQGRYLRTSRDTFWGWNFNLGARWANGMIEDPQPEMLIIPDPTWTVERTIEWLKPSVLYLIRGEDTVGLRLKLACEQRDCPVRDFRIFEVPASERYVKVSVGSRVVDSGLGHSGSVARQDTDLGRGPE